MKGMDPDLAEAPIIKLKQWSDVTFLTYSLMAKAQNNPVNKLRHIFRHNIATLETRETIRRALEQEYQVSQPSAWPGQKFNGEHVEAFNAMMGTPHGSAAAFVAAQHKQQLGLKRVNEVTIFRDSSENRGWHLVFTFEDFGT
ncbi:hypothetical protein M501DRAFT_740367 [Patellaria atrata CBS 101060]|uniref:Uncharacterized protein n=1 Tax=Patellaria atrata CBS 101060 TaxID=1346257 RepID=A0A9P4SC16_9PEZI|nr:hypothetical protein M501DRAFT_740367 [Patellaria atrata CBS 101060]